MLTGLLKRIKTTRVTEDEEEEIKPLSPGARVFNTPRLSCYIVSVFGCKTTIDLQVVKEGAYRTILKHPRFTSKLAFDPKSGKPVGWLQTEIEEKDHLFIPKIDPNIDCPDKFVEDYVFNLTNKPMNFSKPLWEIHILHIRTSKANSVAIFKIHHSIGDGISLISLVLACTRKTSDPEAVPTLPVKKRKYEPWQTSNLFVMCLFVLVLVFKYLWNTLVDLVQYSATMLFLRDTYTPIKAPPGFVGVPKRFLNRTLCLNDIKFVKNSMGMTINDVIFGITQAGLSCYLNRIYGNLKEDGHVQENNLPKRIRMRATLVVNLRPNTSIESMAVLMKGNDKKKWQWGNWIGYILVPFNICLRDDPLGYIRDAKATIDRKKQSLEAPATFAVAKLILKTLGLWVVERLTHRALCNTTLSFSSVVGPVDEIDFFGHPMTYSASSVYGHPHALTIHFQSYMEKMELMIAVDEDIIPDPHTLCDDIVQSLQLAKNAIVYKKSTKS